MSAIPDYRLQRIRDPLYNLIEFGENSFDDAMWKVIQTKEFQRLRRIRQLGFSEFVYPGATHTRFAHSLGVYHMARRLMEIIRRQQDGFDEARSEMALAAALVHDLGHGPFSHAFEDVGRTLDIQLANHETVTAWLLREGDVSKALKTRGSGFDDDVSAVIASEQNDIYSAVVSSQFDADRLDYMQRDRIMTGTQLGMVDLEWILSNLEIGRISSGVDDESVNEVETLVLNRKAIHAAESYILNLFQLYPTVYFHKATRGAEKLFTALLVRLLTLAGEGSWKRIGLPRQHPLLVFAEKPDDVLRMFALDDMVVWGALSFLEKSSKDPLVKDFSGRILNRRLFKCIDIREKLEQKGIVGKDLENACLKVEDALKEWDREQKLQIPAVLVDHGERLPYKQNSAKQLNRIQVRTANGGTDDIGEYSMIVKNIEKFWFSRAYISEADTTSRKHVEDMIARVSAGFCPDKGDEKTC